MAEKQPGRLLGNPIFEEVRPDVWEQSAIRDDLRETLRCLKWGKLYGLISEEAYETGKEKIIQTS